MVEMVGLVAGVGIRVFNARRLLFTTVAES
jgi:hypothetical protein